MLQIAKSQNLGTKKQKQRKVVFVLSFRWTIDQRNPEFQPFKRLVVYTYITNSSRIVNFNLP